MNLNPFDWRGPEFLAFYAVYAAMVIFFAWRRRRTLEQVRDVRNDPARDALTNDPYLIACLRGKKNGPLQVAVVSLMERGLLKAKGSKLHTVRDAVARAVHPLEKAILTKFLKEAEAQTLYGDAIIRGEVDQIEAALKQHHLIPDAAAQVARGKVFLVGLLCLWGVAGLKIGLAISRGRTNIGFLVLLAIVSVVILFFAVCKAYRTASGDSNMGHVSDFFSNLKSNSTQNNTWDMTYLAAVYGIAALPDSMVSTVQELHLRPPRTSDNTGYWGSGCSSGSCSSGSSCSSSSSCSGGSSGGSSCGGGGGCGGCGS